MSVDGTIIIEGGIHMGTHAPGCVGEFRQLDTPISNSWDRSIQHSSQISTMLSLTRMARVGASATAIIHDAVVSAVVICITDSTVAESDEVHPILRKAGRNAQRYPGINKWREHSNIFPIEIVSSGWTVTGGFGNCRLHRETVLVRLGYNGHLLSAAAFRLN